MKNLRFKVGEQARLIDAGKLDNRWTLHENMVGKIVTIECVGPFKGGEIVDGRQIPPNLNGVDYICRFDGNRRSAFFDESLEKPYDGNQKSTWDQGVWKPKDLRIKENV